MFDFEENMLRNEDVVGATSIKEAGTDTT